jgi:hypothetical protein
VDGLINAGAKYTTRQVTNDGIELTRAVNHLAAEVVKTNGGYYFGMEWQPPSPQGQYVQTPLGDQRGTSTQGESLKLAYEIAAPTPELGRR